MSTNNVVPPKKGDRTPANVVLTEFLKHKNMEFAFRRQQVRYTDDNAMIIEPPGIIVEYSDVIAQHANAQTKPQISPDLSMKN